MQNDVLEIVRIHLFRAGRVHDFRTLEIFVREYLLHRILRK